MVFFSLILVRFTSLPPPVFRQLPLSVLSLLPPPLLLLNYCTKASIPVLNRSGDNGDLFSWSQWNAFDSSPLSTTFVVEFLNSRWNFPWHKIHYFQVQILALFRNSQCCAPTTYIQFWNIPIILKYNPVPIQQLIPLPPKPLPLATTSLRSFSVDLPVLNISYKRNRIICDLLCFT